MKNFLLVLTFFSLVAHADTPAPGTVKAKMFSGDGLTSLSATGTSLNVNVTGGGGGGGTVDQGTAGTDPWFVSVRNNAPLPVNACQEDGGHLASIDALLAAPLAVTGTFWQATQPVSGTFWQATQPVSGPLTDTQLRAAAVPVSGTFWQATQPVSLSSVPLPSGAATEATLADVETNTSATATSVASIDSKTPALGQALGGASVPVVLPAAQISTLTPLSTITANAGTGTFTVDGSGFTQPVSGTFWQATQPVSGTFWQATQPVSGPLTDAQLRATSVPVSGTFWQATQPVSGTVTANAGSGTFTVDGSGHTQPVSGTVTANLGTVAGLALDASVTGLQVTQASTTSGQSGTLVQAAVTTAAPSYTTAKTSPLSLTTAGALRIDGSGSTQPVSGTFWQATQPVSGTFWQATQPVSGTFWQATQPVSIATAPVLVAGSAIIGKVGIDQTTPGTTNGVQVNAALPAGSNVIGHVIVDTAPSTAVTQSGTWTVQPGNTANTTPWLVTATPAVPAAVTVKQAAITIGTSAVRLTTDGSAPSSTRRLLVAQLLSTSTAACFFGSSSVTSSSTTRGVQMFAGQVFSFNNDAGDYYAICDASSQTFFITEQE